MKIITRHPAKIFYYEVENEINLIISLFWAITFSKTFWWLSFGTQPIYCLYKTT
jgi:hypothetical protein